MVDYCFIFYDYYNDLMLINLSFIKTKINTYTKKEHM